MYMTDDMQLRITVIVMILGVPERCAYPAPLQRFIMS